MAGVFVMFKFKKQGAIFAWVFGQDYLRRKNFRKRRRNEKWL